MAITNNPTRFQSPPSTPLGETHSHQLLGAKWSLCPQTSVIGCGTALSQDPPELPGRPKLRTKVANYPTASVQGHSPHTSEKNGAEKGVPDGRVLKGGELPPHTPRNLESGFSPPRTSSCYHHVVCFFPLSLNTCAHTYTRTHTHVCRYLLSHPESWLLITSPCVLSELSHPLTHGAIVTPTNRSNHFKG